MAPWIGSNLLLLYIGCNEETFTYIITYICRNIDGINVQNGALALLGQGW